MPRCRAILFYGIGKEGKGRIRKRRNPVVKTTGKISTKAQNQVVFTILCSLRYQQKQNYAAIGLGGEKLYHRKSISSKFRYEGKGKTFFQAIFLENYFKT